VITVMRFLLDVNASGALAGWLMELGHDVVRVSDKDPRMTDEDILSILLQDVLDLHSPDLESGAIVIASTKKVRVRRPIFTA
jgi:predicted nuclease of predicted toxin-antitoxin system